MHACVCVSFCTCVHLSSINSVCKCVMSSYLSSVCPNDVHCSDRPEQEVRSHSAACGNEVRGHRGGVGNPREELDKLQGHTELHEHRCKRGKRETLEIYTDTQTVVTKEEGRTEDTDRQMAFRWRRKEEGASKTAQQSWL